jgi:hypothetical protein
VLRDLGDYPARSPIGVRLPSDEDVAALKRAGGRWRAVVALDDDRAALQAAATFDRVFVLDPLYDTGGLLYAAWHDPFIRDEHARQLAEQAAGLVRLAPLLNAGSAILAPDHLPGSWNPRPAWRRPRPPRADERQLRAWSMRSALVLLYWADRLNAVVCASSPEVVAALNVALGQRPRTRTIDWFTGLSAEDIVAWRGQNTKALADAWTALRHPPRRRAVGCLHELASLLQAMPRPSDETDQQTRLVLGDPWLPEPAMLVRRLFNGDDPSREPALPRRRLRRRPLCLLSS